MDKKQAYENKLENQLKNWNLEYLAMQDPNGLNRAAHRNWLAP